MPIPVALEALFRIELALLAQELDETGMAGLDLFAGGEAVVGEVVAAAARQGQVDEGAEGHRRSFHPRRGVVEVEVEDYASVGLASPGQEALFVRLDEAHG